MVTLPGANDRGVCINVESIPHENSQYPFSHGRICDEPGHPSNISALNLDDDHLP